MSVFTVGHKLAAADLDDFSPAGDVNPGDDIALGSGGVITWAGDTNLYRNAANQLKTDDTLIAANAQVGRPYLHARQVNGSTQTITASTPVAITMTGEVADTINGHSTVSNTARYTPLVAGTYRCKGQLCVATGTALTMVAQFRKNGTASLDAAYGMYTCTTQAFANNTCQCEGTFAMNGTTDYIELWGNSSSTIATAANTTDANSYMIIEWVAP